MKYTDINFQDNFKKIRIRQGLTIQELAIKTNLSRTILYSYQTGKHFPSSKNLKLLAKVLKCKVSDFFI